jgi:hypothetical protein
MASVRVSLSLLFALGFAATVFADTVRVTVDRALVWSRPSGISVIVTQLTKDTTVEVVRRVDDWYEIVLPRGAADPQIRTGYILASQVVVASVGPRSPQANRATPASVPPRLPKKYPAIFTIDAVYRIGRDDLTRSFTAFTDVFAEAGSIATNYGRSTGLALDLMFGQPIWGPLGVGVGADYYPRKQKATVEARIPHPFFFSHLRPATFDTPSLKGHEAAVHIPVMWMPPSFGPVKVLVFGGPSVFRVSQTVVTDLDLDEQYPYDTVTIAGVVTEERKGLLVGYHAGADVGYFFNRSIGIGGSALYSRATMTFDKDAEATTTGFAGAVQAVAGLRFRF